MKFVSWAGGPIMQYNGYDRISSCCGAYLVNESELHANSDDIYNPHKGLKIIINPKVIPEEFVSVGDTKYKRHTEVIKLGEDTLVISELIDA